MPTLADIWRYLETRSTTYPARRGDHAHCLPNSRTRGLTAPTLWPQRAPRSPHTPMANPTRSSTFGTSWPRQSAMRLQGGNSDQLPQNASGSPSGTPHRHATHDGLQHGDPLPETAGLILLRSAWRYRSELAPLYLTATILAQLVAARHPSALLGVGPRCCRRGRVGCWPLFGATAWPTHADRTSVRGDSHASGRRLDRGSDRAWPFHVAAAASSGDRRSDSVGAVVGAPAPSGKGSRRAEARSLAGDRQSRGAGWLAGDVRRGGCVGMASAVPPGTWPDHR